MDTFLNERHVKCIARQKVNNVYGFFFTNLMQRLYDTAWRRNKQTQLVQFVVGIGNKGALLEILFIYITPEVGVGIVHHESICLNLAFRKPRHRQHLINDFDDIGPHPSIGGGSY